ncbi:hypothetical protein C8J57DRAFT_1234496 [Mycena rebaudengoi]|nr:hypothetical protein C8J57DRAFT_1234496 [Mycena rebaudengoi]
MPESWGERQRLGDARRKCRWDRRLYGNQQSPKLENMRTRMMVKLLGKFPQRPVAVGSFNICYAKIGKFPQEATGGHECSEKRETSSWKRSVELNGRIANSERLTVADDGKEEDDGGAVCTKLALFGNRELPGHLSASHDNFGVNNPRPGLGSILRGASMLTLPLVLEQSLPLQLASTVLTLIASANVDSSPDWILALRTLTAFSPLEAVYDLLREKSQRGSQRGGWKQEETQFAAYPTNMNAFPGTAEHSSASTSYRDPTSSALAAMPSAFSPQPCNGAAHFPLPPAPVRLLWRGTSSMGNGTSNDNANGGGVKGNGVTADTYVTAPRRRRPFTPLPHIANANVTATAPNPEWMDRTHQRAILENLIGLNSEQHTSRDAYNSTVFVWAG